VALGLRVVRTRLPDTANPDGEVHRTRSTASRGVDRVLFVSNVQDITV
jgi:hypothetical protein